MRVKVEFTGAVDEVTGVPDVTMLMDDDATYHDVVRKLCDLFPGLMGVVFDEAGRTLLSKMMFRRNRQEYIQPAMMDGKPSDGDCLDLVANPVGG